MSSSLYHALADIEEERWRQMKAEGWTHEHDDKHDNGQLGRAAVCYAMSGSKPFYTTLSEPPAWWPWTKFWWKPTDRRRDLVKAGALIVAEIERLDRINDATARKETHLE